MENGSINNISCVIIAKDAQSTITKTLDSLKDFNDVVLYLNNSKDNTRQIALNYDNVNIIDGSFEGFGKTKNIASTYAKNSWILSLDSDEIIPKKLLDELNSLDLKDKNRVFRLKRDNYFLDKKVNFSGWGKDYLIRLYNKTIYSFNQKDVHEAVEISKNTEVITLKNSFIHNAVYDVNQFLYKVIKYSDLASNNKKTCSFLIVILKSTFAFFRTYFLQLGFLDGYRGFTISVSNFNGKYFRYLKRYINCKTKS